MQRCYLKELVMVTGFPSLSRQAVLPCVEAALPSMVDIAYPCVSLAPLRQKCTFINTCLVQDSE